MNYLRKVVSLKVKLLMRSQNIEDKNNNLEIIIN